MSAPARTTWSRAQLPRRSGRCTQWGVWCSAGALLFASTGCYTTRNLVTMEPLETKFPVSASAQFVDESGAIVDEEGYETVKPFRFERTYEVPRHSDGSAGIELEPELERIVAAAGGDAITELKIEGVNYDSGSHGSAASWKIFGWTMSITGAALIATGAALDAGDALYPVGGVILGVGVASFLLSLTTQDPAKWQLQVSGQVVRRKGSSGGEVEPSDL